MAGVQAGRLSIEIVAEIARLQSDLDKAKRAVKSMSNDIARDTKAANDNISRMGTGFANTGRVITTSAGAQRAAMTQLSFQLGDVAQGFAMGTRPMTIFAQQSGQVIQALSLMTNGSKGLLGFLGGPWGMVISAAAVVLAPLIAKLFETEDAMKGVQFASYKLGDAQSILGSVMDMTTGKINTQKTALLALAQAQIIAGQVQARSDMAAARKTMAGMAEGPSLAGLFPGSFLLHDKTARGGAGDIVDAFMTGGLNTQEAVKGLESLNKTGMITEKTMLNAMKAVTDFGVAAENLKVFQDAEKGMKGDKGALSQFLKDGKSGGSARGGGKAKAGPDAEDIQKRFESQLLGFAQQTLNARQQLATSADERAELELRGLEWARLQQNATINADKNFSAVQKSELVAANEKLADYQRDVVEFKRQQQLQQEAQQIAQAQYSAANDNLQTQMSLADTEADRKALALQIFDAETAYLRSKLEALASSTLVSENERKLAQIQLDALNANAGMKRQAVGQANETSLEKYLRGLNKTPGQINEALDAIKVNGLEALNDGLIDAIVNFKSLGSVARSILRQILSDLLRLQIQQAVIKPLAGLLGLAGSLGGSLGGSGGGTFGVTPNLDAFKGFKFAGGTDFAPGGVSLVGERGPELVNLPRGAQVVPNHELRNMTQGVTHNWNITVAGAMNDREARRTGRQIASAAQREMAQARRSGVAG